MGLQLNHNRRLPVGTGLGQDDAEFHGSESWTETRDGSSAPWVCE